MNMKPINYSVNNGITTFNYELRKFIKWYKSGLEKGYSDKILRFRQKDTITYWTFGTKESPSTIMDSLIVPNFDGFGGYLWTDKMLLNGEYIHRQPLEFRWTRLSEDQIKSIKPIDLSKFPKEIFAKKLT